VSPSSHLRCNYKKNFEWIRASRQSPQLQVVEFLHDPVKLCAPPSLPIRKGFGALTSPSASTTQDGTRNTRKAREESGVATWESFCGTELLPGKKNWVVLLKRSEIASRGRVLFNWRRAFRTRRVEHRGWGSRHRTACSAAYDEIVLHDVRRILEVLPPIVRFRSERRRQQRQHPNVNALVCHTSNV